MTHGIDAGDPSVKGSHIADTFVTGMVKGQTVCLRGRVMGAFDMHALGLVQHRGFDLQPFRHPFRQGAKLHLVQETHDGIRLWRFQFQRIQRQIQRHIGVKLHQTAGNADLLGVFHQSLAPLGLLDLSGAGEKRIEIAIFLNEQSGGFQPDPRGAGHVVDRVACERLHIHHAVGGDAEFLEHLIEPDALVLHRVEHIDAVADQLHQVLVGGDDRHRPPRLARTPGQGGDDVIGLIAVNLDARHVEGAGGGPGKGKLRAQVLRQFGAVGLVGGVDVVAEGLGTGVKDHRDMGGRLFAGMGQLAPEKVAKPRDRPHRHAVGFARQRRQRVIGAKDEGRSVDQMQVIALAECHDPPPLFSDIRHNRAPPPGRVPQQKGHAARSVVVVGMIAVDHKTLVAIATFHPAGLGRDGQPDARMAKRALTPIAGHFPGGDGLGLGGGGGHVGNL